MFSESDSENYFGLRSLVRSPDNSIMPRLAEINGGIDICGEPLKTTLNTLFSFFLNFMQKLIKNL